MNSSTFIFAITQNAKIWQSQSNIPYMSFYMKKYMILFEKDNANLKSEFTDQNQKKKNFQKR